MATYIYDQDLKIMVDKATGLPMLNQFERATAPQAPRVVKDIEPYLSPVTGEYISGKRAKRADLDKHGCIDADELGTKPRKFKNKRFIKKHGLQKLAEV